MSFNPPGQSFLVQLPATDRAQLLKLCESVSIDKGDLIFRAGSPGKNVYFLQDGQVKIYHLSPSGKEVLLWFCFSGDLFGITELCHRGPREVYAQACTHSHVLSINAEVFQQFIATHPQAALLVVQVLSCRLRGLSDLVQAMVTNDVAERVIRLITRLHGTNGSTARDTVCTGIRITHQEIANMIGATRQSVTSALNSLKRLGVVTFNNRRICVNGLAWESVQRDYLDS